MITILLRYRSGFDMRDVQFILLGIYIYIYINVVCCVGRLPIRIVWSNVSSIAPYYPYWQYTDLSLSLSLYIYKYICRGRNASSSHKVSHATGELKKEICYCCSLACTQPYTRMDSYLYKKNNLLTLLLLAYVMSLVKKDSRFKSSPWARNSDKAIWMYPMSYFLEKRSKRLISNWMLCNTSSFGWRTNVYVLW